MTVTASGHVAEGTLHATGSGDVVCGIAGIWKRGGEPVLPATIERFTASLAHRGPDGSGTFIDDAARIALGHRRLSILDPTVAATQPIRSADGRYRTIFNGELYNFVELRDELEGCGYRFLTESDTEIIAAAYDRWGEACQLRFNGMWAFALWDTRERRLFLSRDRFGVKPLYYYPGGACFAFASELKAFLSLDGFAAREFSPALARALDDPFAAEAFEESPLDGVLRLLPGHRIVVAPGKLEVARWWNTLDHLVTPPARFSAQAERLRELIFDAARLRLRSDVPVAVALSGGLDSSAVLGSLAAIDARGSATTGRAGREADWRRAFTATFAGTPLDERRYAEDAARKAHVPLEEVPIRACATEENIARVVRDLDEITFTDPTPIWSLYRALGAAGLKVALNGDGADELFGGYLHHAQHALATSRGFLRAPLRYVDLVDTLHHMPGTGGPIARTGRVALALRNDALLHALSSPGRRLYRRFRPGASLGYVRRTAIRADLSATAWDAQGEALGAGLSPLGAHLYAEFHATKLPAILRTFDRASMAHGVEIRNAFLDWRIVCFAFSLPDESKLGGGFSKRIVREAMRSVVPETIRSRRGKIGFNAPLPQWFAGPMREWLWKRVNEPSFLESDLWDGAALRDFVGRKRSGEAWRWGDGEAIWPFLHAHLWREHFLSA